MADDALLLGHLARSRAVLEILRKDGVQLDTPRRINVFFWCPTSTSAHGMAEALNAGGYVEVVTSEPQNPVGEGRERWWSAQGERVERPAVVASAEFTETILALARQHGAEFDGWGTGYQDSEGTSA
jgi:hypothetical protein